MLIPARHALLHPPFLDTSAKWPQQHPCSTLASICQQSAVQVPLIVARYGGDPALMGMVATAVQLHQSDADALLAAHLFATILERFTVFGGTLQVSPSR